MVDRLRLYADQLKLAGRYTERFAQDHCMWFARMQRILVPYLHDFHGVRALDVGCGLLQWQTIMLHSLRAKVTGLDTEFIREDRRPDKYWRIWQTNGLERAIKTAFWDYTYRERYLNALQACSPFSLKRKGMDLRQHTAEQLPFADGEFDLVVSHEVFEHIADVESAVKEHRRVLKSGGLAYINIHLFPSISGGHHVEWKYPDTDPSTKVPPWDHLRDRRFTEHPSWINAWREQQYRLVFDAHFELLYWEASAYEGHSQLTPSIEAELTDKGYTKDEVLKKGVIILARKS